MKKRKLLSIVLSLCMALALMPATVFAEVITPETPQKDTDGVYQIGTPAELYWFAGLVNGTLTDGIEQNTSASAVLTADIVVNTGVLKADGTLADDTSGFTSWTPIGTSSNYTGEFDGQGHTISGLYFNDAAKYYVGLFGSLGENGEIKNVGVIDSYFNGYWGVGGVCGISEGGKITGCYNTGTVSGYNENVGGVCGKSYGATISGCYNTGTVSSNDYHVGGVCGSTYFGDTITGCYNTGTVSGDSYIGGVCGYNGFGGEATITGCYNTGRVSGNRNIGGVCGKNDHYSSITGCYNTGTVSGDYRIGGVCGLNDNNGSIIGCYNIGTVSSNNDNVGGVCGWNWGKSSITGCFTNKGVVCGENKSTETDCAVKSDKEFADSTVCKLLDTALQNASSDVRFCQRIGKDASPLLTYQFESIDDHTDKNPKDHICDICGEMLSDHIGIDENPKDHICDICRETLSTHTGGEATCKSKAICEYCGEEYGELDSSKHKLANTSAKAPTYYEVGHKEYWQCKDCKKCFSDEAGKTEIADIDAWKAGDGKIDKLIPPKTDSVTSDKDGNVSVSIEKSIITTDGKTEASITDAVAESILDKLTSSESKSVVISASAGSISSKPAASGASTEISISGTALKKLSEVDGIRITFVTDNGKVVLDGQALAAASKIEGEDGTVTLVIETVEQTGSILKLDLKIKASSSDVTDFGGGIAAVTVAISDELKGRNPVCVYIDAQGIYHMIGGTLNDDGTFTFATGHFSTYAIMPEEKAAAIIKQQTAEAQKAAIKKVKPSVSLTTKKLKKGIKVTVKVPASQKADKTGVIIYRSQKKSSDYVKYKRVKTSGSSYTVTNTKNLKGKRLIKGKKYYYKARAYKVIDGKTYYGPTSSIKYARAR